jgi:hypothetical protein
MLHKRMMGDSERICPFKNAPLASSPSHLSALNTEPDRGNTGLASEKVLLLDIMVRECFRSWKTLSLPHHSVIHPRSPDNGRTG